MWQPPVWLESLIEIAAGSTESQGPPYTLSYRCGEDSGLWTVDVYPTPVELVGGNVDGEVGSPGFSMDLEELCSAFDRIDGLRWSVYHHLDGPEVSISGLYEGHEVYLRILAQAPADEEPTTKLDVSGASATAPDVN